MKFSVRYAIYAICIIILFPSCSKNRIRKIMIEFVKSEIIIPDSLDCIYNNKTTKIMKDSLKSYKYVVYYDSLNCTSCRISNITELSPLYKISDTTNMTVLTIFAPKKSEIHNVKFQLLLYDLNFPIYIDTNGDFQKLNPHLPTDHLFHNFLINPSGIPVFVGNPLYSDKLNKLLNTLIINIK